MKYIFFINFFILLLLFLWLLASPQHFVIQLPKRVLCLVDVFYYFSRFQPFNIFFNFILIAVFESHRLTSYQLFFFSQRPVSSHLVTFNFFPLILLYFYI